MSSQSNIAFWCPGMDYWTPPTENWGAELEDWQKLTCNGPIEDVTYYSYIGPLGEGLILCPHQQGGPPAVHAEHQQQPRRAHHHVVHGDVQRPRCLCRSCLRMYRKMRRGDFCCPMWVTTDARKLIKMLLDPNPGTCITVAGHLETPWFRKNAPVPCPITDLGLAPVDTLGKADDDKRRTSRGAERGRRRWGGPHGARTRHAVRDAGAIERCGRVAGGACDWRRHAHARDEERRRAGARGGSPWR
uniref:Uncharacterized protein n=1 Tax=Oryza meridionalis TaxID=40149 RepID=A0A0E0EEA3_9ORYZ